MLRTFLFIFVYGFSLVYAQDITIKSDQLDRLIWNKINDRLASMNKKPIGSFEDSLLRDYGSRWAEHLMPWDAPFEHAQIRIQPTSELKKIESSLSNFTGTVTEAKVDSLISDLISYSTDTSMCLVTLFLSGCDLKSSDVFSHIKDQLMDLVGRDVELVINKRDKPWSDENYYQLWFNFKYLNTNSKFDYKYTHDSFDFGILDGAIKNVSHSRFIRGI